MYNAKEGAEICNVPYSTFLRWCQQGSVTECTLEQQNHKRGRLKGKMYKLGKNFRVKIPYTAETIKRAIAR